MMLGTLLSVHIEAGWCPGIEVQPRPHLGRLDGPGHVLAHLSSPPSPWRLARRQARLIHEFIYAVDLIYKVELRAVDVNPSAGPAGTRPGRRPGRPPLISREHVLACALQIVDRDG